MGYDKNTDWFVLWCEDKESIINTMARNMAADLEVGYNYFGNSIQRQIKEINEYRAAYNAELDKIAGMEPSRVNHYCYIKLLQAGAITA